MANIYEMQKAVQQKQIEAKRLFALSDSYRAGAAFADGQAYYADMRKADEAYSKAIKLVAETKAELALIADMMHAEHSAQQMPLPF